VKKPVGGTGDPLATARQVLALESKAIGDLIARLDSSFLEAVETMQGCRGRVVVTGLGKSGLIGKKIAATLASTGTPSLFMHPAEAVHGDLGMIVEGDVVLALSNSGETAELLQLMERIKRLGVRLISMTGSETSTLASQSDIHLNIGVTQEACPLDLVPTASTTASLALGDALAITLAELKGFREEDFAQLHPAGRLGRKVLTVGQLMHKGEALPRVLPETTIREAIYEMSAKRLGLTTVCEADGTLAGMVTDGDLRRLMEKVPDPLRQRASDVMTKTPVTITASELATAALHLMESRHITALVVIDARRCVEGVVHLHDLWRTQLV